MPELRALIVWLGRVAGLPLQLLLLILVVGYGASRLGISPEAVGDWLSSL